MPRRVFFLAAAAAAFTAQCNAEPASFTIFAATALEIAAFFGAFYEKI